jgi:hypothetical protein
MTTPGTIDIAMHGFAARTMSRAVTIQTSSVPEIWEFNDLLSSIGPKRGNGSVHDRLNIIMFLSRKIILMRL